MLGDHVEISMLDTNPMPLPHGPANMVQMNHGGITVVADIETVVERTGGIYQSS